jgi:hypothetical protein
MLATIGYERSSLADFVATLVHSEIEILSTSVTEPSHGCAVFLNLPFRKR